MKNFNILFTLYESDKTLINHSPKYENKKIITNTDIYYYYILLFIIYIYSITDNYMKKNKLPYCRGKYISNIVVILIFTFVFVIVYV